jgi:predicted unusual protein kinase regulating ubiquinone biosynthesis (AarF/ABC1/UbiB family)
VPEKPSTPPSEPDLPIVLPPVIVPETPSESLKSLVDIAPAELTPAQVEQIQEIAYEVLATSEQGSPEYEAALDALFVTAQADDIEVSEELAAVPVIGAVAEGVVNAINFIGNVGSDMSPIVREKSEKIVVSAVVVAQVATAAVMTTSSVRRFQ